MFDIPKEFFNQLICSSCKKYLCVLPIKVYSNREVKCGRCCKDSDGGTVSTLYQTVIENVPFPCIYRKEGCRELCLASKMKDHESKCSQSKKKYDCPVCYDHLADSHNLSLHIDEAHKDIILEEANFLLCFDGDNGDLQRKDFFYQGDDILLYLSLNYDSKLVRFESRTTATDGAFIQFSLLSVEPVLLKQTDKVQCSEWNNSLDPVLVNLDITDTQFPSNVVLCKFQAFRERVSVLPSVLPSVAPLLSLAEPPVHDGSVSRALLRFTFKGFSVLQGQEDMCSDISYYLMNLPWKLFIRKKFSGFSGPCLDVILALDNTKEASPNIIKSIEFRRILWNNKLCVIEINCEFRRIFWNNKECAIITEEQRVFNTSGLSFEIAPGLISYGFGTVPWQSFFFNTENNHEVNDTMIIEVDLSVSITPWKINYELNI